MQMLVLNVSALYSAMSANQDITWRLLKITQLQLPLPTIHTPTPVGAENAQLAANAREPPLQTPWTAIIYREPPAQPAAQLTLNVHYVKLLQKVLSALSAWLVIF